MDGPHCLPCHRPSTHRLPCANGTAGGPPAAAGANVTLKDGSTYTCVKDPWAPKNAENKWEIHQMPIKASYADAFYRAHPNPNPKTNPDPKTNPNPNHRYADAFYRACANDQFCDTGSFWSCKGHVPTPCPLRAHSVPTLCTHSAPGSSRSTLLSSS